MSVVVLEQVSLSFGPKRIVEDLGLRIADGDRIGLIGPNGSGKTTLLRLIAGEQAPDGGSVRRARGARVGWLPQDLDVIGGRSLVEFVLASVPGRAALEEALGSAEEDYQRALADGGDEETLLQEAARLAELHERLAHFDTLFSEHEALKILHGLGFREEDRGRDVGELSGGWKMRCVLASLLFQQPDVLLLDEPTNHLDMPSVAWFSAFLKRYGRPFVMISHDREFLNEQINRVVSLEVEGVRQFPGDYEAYVKARAEEEEILENKATNLEREREKAQQFIDRFRAKASKAKAVQSKIKALEKMETVETYRKRRVMSFSFPATDRAGHEVVRVEELEKAYGDHVVLPGVDCTVYRGDRVGIIGPNGAGKTTLLKLIAGETEPTGGRIELGHRVKPGYYAQHHAELLHRKNAVYDEVFAVNREAGQTRVRTVLGAFLFSGDDVDKPIGVLSGGERARVALAKLLLDPGNLLLLDEPTNHLDLESTESLIATLDTYDGTMVFVSHNRALVRRLATKIWAVEDGRVTEYAGNLDDYLRQWRARYEGDGGDAEGTPAEPPAEGGSRHATAPAAAPSPEATPENGAGGGRASREEAKRRRREEAKRRQERSRKLGGLERKVADLEKRIAEIETKQAERNDRLCAPEGFASEEERFAVLTAMQVDAEKLEELTGRWEHLQEELDRAQAS
ncbi:MAG: ABC-F family ATP-binding cassette domain-containing protein [Sandaracinaceae bacterium]